jgi:YD repeat-containing protein
VKIFGSGWGLRIAAAMLGALAMLPGAALAQSAPAKDYYIGDGEVELWAGLFMYSNTDLVVGGPEDAGGLSLVRYTNVREQDSHGPSTGHSQEVFIYRDRYKEEGAGAGLYNYAYYVVRGRTVKTFEKYWHHATIYNAPDAKVTLTSTGEHGPYVFTDEDGTVINFPVVDTNCPMLYKTWTCTRASNVIRPNGVVHSFGYDAPGGVKRLRLVTSNRGFGMGFEYDGANKLSRVCTLNIAVAAASVSSPCPVGSPSATYTYGQDPATFNKWSTFTNAGGQTTNYTYAGNSGVATIRGPGSVVDDLTVTYQPVTGRVGMQTYANGAAYTYSYENVYPPDPNIGNMWTKVTNPAGAEVLHDFSYGIVPKPGSIVDEIGRTTHYRWAYGIHAQGIDPIKVINPEGDEIRYAYDTRGNQTEVRRVAKAASGLADIVSSTTFPATCVSRVYCNKPLTKTDAKGNTTTYTYDTTHGGVLTETGPAVGGVAPQKRYEYAQRYAWVQNATNTAYVQAPTPVWLLVRERYCKTTAASGASCAGGAADEVVTDYDYGPNSGPNILLLRGVAVTADGQTLRSCYGYDAYGRKVSETKPGANLASCP